MPDLETLLDRLVRNEVEFVVIGGFAAVVHGVTLVTKDIDICCHFEYENLHRLERAVADLHPVHRMTPQRLPFTLAAQNCQGLQNLYLQTDIGPLDCLSEVAGVGRFDEIQRHSMQVKLATGICHVMSIDDLIKAKEAMGRTRDKQTVLQLKAIKERLK